MGVPTTGGARGKITVDTSDLKRAQKDVQDFSRAITNAFNSVGASIGAAQFARLAVDASKLATAYDRQAVAAQNLAGGQAKLNSLLDTYAKATGGAVDKAAALQNVTKLMAVGFADNTKELDQFARAIRGISLAMGSSQDTVTQNLILELFSQRGQRLDQLGLQYDVVRKRADELRAADATLTTQMAYQNAVMEQAEQKFGALADSAAGSATGLEQAERAWNDLKLALGELGNATIFGGFDRVAHEVDEMAQHFNELRDSIEDAKRALGGGGGSTGGGTDWWNTNLLPILNNYVSVMAQLKYGVDPRVLMGPASPPAGQAARDVARHPRVGGASGPAGLSGDQVAAYREQSAGLGAIERDAARDRLDATRDYNRQVSNIERDFATSRTREAEDYARQRLNAERKFNLALLDVAQDSARQRSRWQADLERDINERRQERDERVSDLREDSAKRLGDIEEKYEKERLRRAKDLNDDLLDAAGRLDAKQVDELQRRAAKQEEEAKEAHQEQVENERESLQERIDDANDAFTKFEQQQRDSLQRRIEEQAENDALRIQEMKEAFAEQKEQEDIERAIRLDRQAEDHQNQLTELATQHNDRIQQIKDQAAEEIEQFNDQWNKKYEELGIANDAWLKEQRRLNDETIKLHQQLLERERWALSMPPGHPALADPYDLGSSTPTIVPRTVQPQAWTQNSTSRNVTVQPGAIVVQTHPGMSRQEVLGIMADFLEGLDQ